MTSQLDPISDAAVASSPVPQDVSEHACDSAKFEDQVIKGEKEIASPEPPSSVQASAESTGIRASSGQEDESKAGADADADGAMIVSLLNELKDVREELALAQDTHNRSAGDLGTARRIVRELHHQLQLLLEKPRSSGGRGESAQAGPGISGDVVASLAYRLAEISVSREVFSAGKGEACCSSQIADKVSGQDQDHDGGDVIVSESGGTVSSPTAETGADASVSKLGHEQSNLVSSDPKTKTVKRPSEIKEEIGVIASSLLEEVDRASAASWRAASASTSADKMLASAEAKVKAEEGYEELDRVIASAMQHIDEADASDEARKLREEVQRREREEALKMMAWSEEYEKRLFNLEGVFEILTRRVEDLEQRMVAAARSAAETGGRGGVLDVGSDRGEIAQTDVDIVVGFCEEEDWSFGGSEQEQESIACEGADSSVESRLARLEGDFNGLSGRVDHI
ncbi:hypothetical protein I316_04259 [Kwoniella heveanensis BCC8398]|uniref:Uncharacterized protein n=1 Tax=Kwoniella heveanensis BCC8398 TaxID=1296120 RepID=A0A1B9GSF2_9TREE|nr:hypothetical protein I316_04259 [Kwoniella heveanensis BCC8398]